LEDSVHSVASVKPNTTLVTTREKVRNIIENA